MDNTTCGWCEKKIESSDRPQYVALRFGKFVVQPSGGQGPYHPDCAAKFAKARNASR